MLTEFTPTATRRTALRRINRRNRINGVLLAMLLASAVGISNNAWCGEGAFEKRPDVTTRAPVTQRPAIEPTLTLDDIQGWRAPSGSPRSSESDGVGNLRRQLLMETAQGVAASAALATETQVIQAVFEKYSSALDQVYRFDQLTLHEGLVLPPIIKEASDMASLEQGTLKRVQRSYRLSSPAQLLTRAPSWRQWLIANIPFPEKPLDQLLPRSDEEQAIWREAAALGWTEGLKQAHQVARIRLARLQQSFAGMIRYHLLLANRMITEPKLKKTKRGVRQEGVELRIGEALYRITRKARFRTGDWTVYPELPSLFEALEVDVPAADGILPPPPPLE